MSEIVIVIGSLLGFIALLALIASPFILIGLKMGKKQKVMMDSAKALYDKALFDLQEEPDNSEKYQKALLKGREYYSYLHPNTYDMNRNGVTSNHQDNSGVIELKVQSDLQARTLKSKGKIS